LEVQDVHVFITGATGWVGSAVVGELIGAGHRVTGLARGPDKADALKAAGAEPLIGDLDQIDLLRAAAGAADAVIHTAFNHDFSKFAENALQDRRAIEALGRALAGSDRPLLVTSGLARLAPGRVAVETDLPAEDASMPRRSEAAARALAAQGVRAATIRLAPSVHGLGDHGFVPILIAIARQTGVSAYVDDGANRWPGVHRSDAARLYRLALDHGAALAAYHATENEGVTFKSIAEVIGRRLGLPVQTRPREHFGWFANFAAADMPASSALTQAALGWRPTGPDLLSDLDQPGYFAA
jgi:nucleoside-diphosphate-sugar epimerase